jgi:organic radical activating enzyme
MILHNKSVIDNVVILGGEPLEHSQEVCVFVNRLKSVVPNLTFWLFTSYELDEVIEHVKQRFDYIKTGKYIRELTTDNNVQYGYNLATSNQKIHYLR